MRLLRFLGAALLPVAAASLHADTPAYLPASDELATAHETVEFAFGVPDSAPRVFVLAQGRVGHPNVDASYIDRPLRIAGQTYPHGIGVHAPSDLLVRLGRPVSRLRTAVGYDDNEDTRERAVDRVIFSVEAGGKVVWESRPLTPADAAVPCDLTLDGATEFHLKARAENGNAYQVHADWIDPQVEFADGSRQAVGSLISRGNRLTTLPFSFVLGGESSRTFLAGWKRTIETAKAEDRVRHTIRWAKPDGTFEVRCELVEFLRHPALEWKLFFKNTGATDSPVLEQLLSLDAAINRHRSLIGNTAHEDVPVVLGCKGSDNRNDDFSPFTQPVQGDQPVRFLSNIGHSSETYLPFWNFTDGPCGIVTAVGWSADWQASFRRVNSMQSNMQAGLGHVRFSLPPGEEIMAPSICLLFWEGSESLRGNNLFRRYMRDVVAPKWAGGPTPNSYSMSGGSVGLEGVNERNQLDYIAKIAGTGAETYWMDAGWYPLPKGGSWHQGRGNWFADPTRFPRGLKPLADAAHAHGLKFLLWFDPELAAANSQVAHEHPEWMLRKNDRETGLFNLGAPGASRYLTDLVAQKIIEYDVDIYRNDWNIEPAPRWKMGDTPGRTGLTEIRYVMGFYRFWDGLLAAKPGLLIDNCAGGGRRIDYETCKRSVPLWRSDYECEVYPDVYEASQNQTYGLSYFLPYHGTGQGITFDPYKDRSLTTTSVVLSGFATSPEVPADLPHGKVKKVWEDLKAYCPLMAYDYYPLTAFTPGDNNWMALQYDHPEVGEGCVIAFRRRNAPFTAAEFKLRAVEAQASYRLTFLNTGEQRTVSGSTLLALPLSLQPGESAVIKYQKL